MQKGKRRSISVLAMEYLECANYSEVSRNHGLSRTYVHSVIDEYMSDMICKNWKRMLWERGALAVRQELIYKLERQKKRALNGQGDWNFSKWA